MLPTQLDSVDEGHLNALVTNDVLESRSGIGRGSFSRHSNGKYQLDVDDLRSAFVTSQNIGSQNPSALMLLHCCARASTKSGMRAAMTAA